jgi:hypothetical protein
MRRLKVFLGITATSAAVGALSGMLCAAGVLLLTGESISGLFDSASRGIFGFAAQVGAGCGVVLGPLASFGFMRRVPLGRLFAETAIGTVLAGIVASMLPLGFDAVLGVAAGGFLAAATRLAWVYRPMHETAALPSPEQS